MSTDRMKLVQGDTRPPVVVSLTDAAGAIDVSDPGLVVRMYFRAEGSETVAATLTGTKLLGYDAAGDGLTVSFDPPYNVAGAGGRVQFGWTAGALDGDAGNYEGEVEITYADGSTLTVYDTLKFKLREQF